MIGWTMVNVKLIILFQIALKKIILSSQQNATDMKPRANGQTDYNN